jgi:hypothetical protein
MTETITITIPTWLFLVICGLFAFRGVLELYALHLKRKIAELENV